MGIKLYNTECQIFYEIKAEKRDKKRERNKMK